MLERGGEVEPERAVVLYVEVLILFEGDHRGPEERDGRQQRGRDGDEIQPDPSRLAPAGSPAPLGLDVGDLQSHSTSLRFASRRMIAVKKINTGTRNKAIAAP